jgi:hypothetical protein
MLIHKFLIGGKKMKLNERGTKQLGLLLDNRSEQIKKGNQGSSFESVLGSVAEFRKISDAIESVSLNYYDCDGVTVAVIKINDRPLTYDNGVSEFETKGFKIMIGNGNVSHLHLSHYTWLWKIVDKPVAKDYGKILEEITLDEGRRARLVIGLHGEQEIKLDRSVAMDGSDFRTLTEQSRYYEMARKKFKEVKL